MLVRQRNQKGLRHQTQIHGRTWRDTALRRSIPKHDPCDQLESVRTCQKAADVLRQSLVCDRGNKFIRIFDREKCHGKPQSPEPRQLHEERSEEMQINR